jgi:hypothetical protein
MNSPLGNEKYQNKNKELEDLSERKVQSKSYIESLASDFNWKDFAEEPLVRKGGVIDRKRPSFWPAPCPTRFWRRRTTELANQDMRNGAAPGEKRTTRLINQVTRNIRFFDRCRRKLESPHRDRLTDFDGHQILTRHQWPAVGLSRFGDDVGN